MKSSIEGLKKTVSFVLIAAIMLVSVLSDFSVQISAASTLTISSPQNDTYVRKSDLPKLTWNSVSGAAGYKVTILDTTNQVDIVRNKWTTSKSFALDTWCEDIEGSPLLKIWVGAMVSEDADPTITGNCLAEDIVWIRLSEVPEITNDGYSNVVSDGATLKMTVVRNFASAIIDAGFYIGTSSLKSKATKYSFEDYGPSDVVSKGQMTMEISGLESDKRYYYWAYAENGLGESVSERDYFRTAEEEVSLSVSKTSVSWNWAAENKTDITVTSSGSYSYSVDYDVSSTVESSGYNYEWLTVSKSGSTLSISPNRANYSSSSRTAYITVTSGNVSKEITVTQTKCGEASPSITLYRGSTVYSNGDTIGSYTLPQDAMEVWVSATNVRKLTADLLTSSGDYISTCTNPSHISLDISNLDAGDYKIIVYASNSTTSNDYWSQRPFANGSMTLYFSLKGSGTSDDEVFNGISHAKDYSDMPTISKNASESSADWTTNNTIVYVQQYYSVADLYNSSIWENNVTGRCTRSSASSAFSYLNIKALPKNIGDTIGNLTSGCKYCYDKPYGTYAEAHNCTVENLRFCKGEMTAEKFIEMYNRYANDTSGKYSPPVIYTNYGSGQGMHTLLIVGHCETEDDVFYTLDPGQNGGYLYKIRLKVVEGQIRICERANYEGVWSTNSYNETYAPRQIWQYVANSSSQTYTITYNYNYAGGSVKTETKTHGETYAISKTIIPTQPSTETSTTITSYEFCGWSTSEDGGIVYQPGDAYTQNSNLTLYAQWAVSVTNKPQAEVTVYSVIYDANGGSNAPSISSGVQSGTTITLSSVKPTRSGYTFLGWSLEKNDVAADYQPGDSYTVRGETTLYAVWELQTYTISGVITSYTSSGNYTVVLYDSNGIEYDTIVSGNSNYAFEVVPGEYTLEVSKKNHITCMYEIVVGSQNKTQNVALYLLGDTTGDGIVDSTDYLRVKGHFLGTYTLSGNSFAAGDVTGDGEIDGTDYLRIKSYLLGDFNLHG